MRNFELPGRSVVMARNGMAATSHPSATLTAINVLRRGGNALDAAVAACAVQCVVEPGSTGIGGDCFAMFSPRGSDQVVAFNGAGWAPAAATAGRLKAFGLNSIPRTSAHAVTVPGAVDAWATLVRDHGSRPLAELLQPAIELAEEGYAVSPRVSADWHDQREILAGSPHAADVFLQDGAPPLAGTLHRQPALARTLRKIAVQGAAGFYQGDVAHELAAYLQNLGGLHTVDDFAAYGGEYVKPIRARFRGYDVIECPPPGQGVIALLILNILAGFDLDPDPLSADRLHREIEATRLAYSVRDAVLADPSHAPVDTDWLLSRELADTLRARIDLRSAMTEVERHALTPHTDTVYITVVDKDRNCASFINSLFSPFGSGLLAPQCGVLLHNRGQGFSLEEGHPNAIAPNKRPLHTIIPAMVARDGRVRWSFGVMGGHYQAMGHAHFLSKVIDYGMDMQTAIDLPRLFPRPESDHVEVESTMPVATREALKRRGFHVTAPRQALGGAQAICIDWENDVLTGASDARKDGCALGL
jgi:gamma-glutamyltranspeptidase/glutathione hydrolase